MTRQLLLAKLTCLIYALLGTGNLSQYAPMLVPKLDWILLMFDS